MTGDASEVLRAGNSILIPVMGDAIKKARRAGVPERAGPQISLRPLPTPLIEMIVNAKPEP